MDIEKTHKDTQGLLKSYDSLIQSIMEELEPDMIELNKSQLLQGKNAVGGQMPEYANNPRYLRLKRRVGSKSLPNMDYKLTGKFHESFKAKTDKIGTEIFATDFKKKFLEKRVAGEELYGVTDENIDKLVDKAADLLEQKIRKALRI